MKPVLALAVILAGLAALLGPTQVARAAEYRMSTRAEYEVRPQAREIAVSVAITFRNTTPNPPGRFSVFDSVELAIHPGAAAIAARDRQGRLKTDTVRRDGFVAVSIGLRNAVRYRHDVDLSLSYVIPDGAGGDVRVRPSAIVFPAWSFGTSGRVHIELPATDVEVRVDGSELTADRTPRGVTLESGRVTNPRRWLALVVATRASDLVDLDRAIPLEGGTVDLNVRAWGDDAAWGRRTRRLLAEALPLFEREMGIDYPGVGPLVVVEALPEEQREFGESDAGGAEIAIAFDEPAFTALHQVAHVWLSGALAGERWIREGFASHVAARVARQLDVSPPYDPAARAEDLEAAAFPLVSWGSGQTSPRQEAWAYADAWAVADELGDLVGEGRLRQAWQRVAAGIGAYEPVGDDPPSPSGAPVSPVDSRQLLDQLEAVSGVQLEDVFAARVFDGATIEALDARSQARSAYAGLVAAAGDWGAPDPVRILMAGWRFDDAGASVAAAKEWLGDRDALIEEIEGAGLSMPARLRDAYRSAGGETDARQELDAESSVVAAYRLAVERSVEPRSILERVGLLGSADPADLLREANIRFSEGDLRGAADVAEEAWTSLESAGAEGVTRLASAAAVAIGLLIGAVLLVRRRRSSGYTAAP